MSIPQYLYFQSFKMRLSEKIENGVEANEHAALREIYGFKREMNKTHTLTHYEL